MFRRTILHQCCRNPLPSRSLSITPILHTRPPPPTWEGYTPDSLDAPLHSLPVPPPSAIPSSASASPSPPHHLATSSLAYEPSSSTRDEVLARASIVFGTKLGGPVVRPPPHLDPRSSLIANVYVPPKPEEPDNCCMSGCVHCVWDRWREEMEVWADMSREAEGRLAAREGGDGGKQKKKKDGGEELFGGVPVGIREFMKLEKKLKAGQAG